MSGVQPTVARFGGDTGWCVRMQFRGRGNGRQSRGALVSFRDEGSAMLFDGSRLQDRFNAWLLRVGQLRVVVAITLFSCVLSVVMTGIGNVVFMPEVPWEEWFYISLIVPIFISPIVSTLVLSLLYQLAEARAALATMAETDPLTGVGNRRHFFNVAPEIVRTCAEKGQPVSIVLIDVDHFKRLNDSFGHAVGDEALNVVARTCRKGLREGDVFCRWGGEEFIALLPAVDLVAAVALADRLRADIDAAEIEGVPDGVTISAGVAQFDRADEALDTVIADADHQLYRASCVRGLRGGRTPEHGGASAGVSKSRRLIRRQISRRRGAAGGQENENRGLGSECVDRPVSGHRVGDAEIPGHRGGDGHDGRGRLAAEISDADRGDRGRLRRAVPHPPDGAARRGADDGAAGCFAGGEPAGGQSALQPHAVQHLSGRRRVGGAVAARGKGTRRLSVHTVRQRRAG